MGLRPLAGWDGVFRGYFAPDEAAALKPKVLLVDQQDRPVRYL